MPHAGRYLHAVPYWTTRRHPRHLSLSAFAVPSASGDRARRRVIRSDDLGRGHKSRRRRTGRRLRSRRFYPVTPPIPRRFKLTLPHSAFCVCSLSLLVDIILGEAAIGKRPTLADHPSINILAGNKTYGDNTIVLIPILWPAFDRPSCNLVRQRRGCTSAARPCPALQGASLRAFRRVDTEEPDSGAVDLDRIAINDGRLAGNLLRRTLRLDVRRLQDVRQRRRLRNKFRRRKPGERNSCDRGTEYDNQQ